MIYLIGSLRSPRVPLVARTLRRAGFDVFDDWHAAGPHADDEWRRYERDRGSTLIEALAGEAARHTFYFDLRHLHACTTAVLVLPAGRSGHLELGYALGMRKHGAVLLDEPDPERWDVMYRFADAVCADLHTLIGHLREWEST